MESARRYCETAARKYELVVVVVFVFVVFVAGLVVVGCMRSSFHILVPQATLLRYRISVVVVVAVVCRQRYCWEVWFSSTRVAVCCSTAYEFQRTVCW